MTSISEITGSCKLLMESDNCFSNALEFFQIMKLA